MTPSNRTDKAHQPHQPARTNRRIGAACALLASALFAAAAAPSTAQAGQDLSGHWVLLQHTVTRAEVPVVGTIFATTRVVSVHKLDHKGNRLHGAGTMCSIDIDSGTSFVKTILPEAFKRSLPPPRIDARLTDGEGGMRFKQKRQIVVVGAKLKRPRRDKMPTLPNDKRVFDQDGDGHPGVTIVVDGIVSGEMYVAQRSWTKLSGRRTGDDSFGGRVYFGNEQHILAATTSMLKDPPKVRPVPSRSFFKLKRVAGATSCAAANRLAAQWKP